MDGTSYIASFVIALVCQSIGWGLYAWRWHHRLYPGEIVQGMRPLQRNKNRKKIAQLTVLMQLLFTMLFASVVGAYLAGNMEKNFFNIVFMINIPVFLLTLGVAWFVTPVGRHLSGKNID